MSTEMQVDIVVGTTDAQEVERIEAQLADLDPTRGDATREPITILAVTAGAIALAKELVELWQTMHDKREQPKPQPSITIEVQSGAILQLGSVQSAEEIERFVAEHSPAPAT